MADVVLSEKQILQMQKLAQGTATSVGGGGANSEPDQKIIYENLRMQAETDPNFAAKLDALSTQRISLRVATNIYDASPGRVGVSAGAGSNYAIKIDPKDLKSGAPVLDMVVRGVAKADAYNASNIKENAAHRGGPLSETDKAELARNETTIRRLEAVIPGAGTILVRPPQAEADTVEPAQAKAGVTQAAPAVRSVAPPPKVEPLQVDAGANGDGPRLRAQRVKSTVGTATRLGTAVMASTAVLGAITSAPGATVSAGSALTGDQSAGFRMAGLANPPVPGRPNSEGLIALSGFSGGMGGGLGQMIRTLLEGLTQRLGGSSSMTFTGSTPLMRQMMDATGAKPVAVAKVAPDGQSVTASALEGLDPNRQQIVQQQLQQTAPRAGMT